MKPFTDPAYAGIHRTYIEQCPPATIREGETPAVVWLIQALQNENRRLKVGDWISLGSFSALMPPQAGQQITVDYKGLPGAQPVKVQFE